MREGVRGISYGSPGLRLLQLFLLLSSSGKAFTLTRLATLFRCSRQSVLRMVEQLGCAPGIDLATWVEQRERHYRLNPPPRASGLSFTDGTLRTLALLRDALRHLLPEAVQHELADVLDGASWDDGPVGEAWLKGRIDYAPFQTILDDLQTALREHRLCRLRYRARRSGACHRYTIAPLRLVVYREALFVRCRLYDERGRPEEDFRTLAVHRMLELRLGTDTFPDPPQDDHDAYFGFPVHEPVRVRAAFHGPAATYVAERIWSADQTLNHRHDGSVELAFTATSRFEVVAWVLGFGPDAELLAPQDLRDELRDKAAAICARYTDEKDRRHA